MPELYTFVTERTDDFSIIEEIKNDFVEWNIEVYTVHEMKGMSGKPQYFISGCNWEEDCGSPIDLTLVFAGSGLRCVYCNHNEYGIIDGAEDMQLQLNNPIT